MRILIFVFFALVAFVVTIFTYSCCVVVSKADDAEEEYWEQNADHCVMCGKVIPEGRMVCLQCELNLKK